MVILEIIAVLSCTSPLKSQKYALNNNIYCTIRKQHQQCNIMHAHPSLYICRLTKTLNPLEMSQWHNIHLVWYHNVWTIELNHPVQPNIAQMIPVTSLSWHTRCCWRLVSSWQTQSLLPAAGLLLSLTYLGNMILHSLCLVYIQLYSWILIDMPNFVQVGDCACY